VLGVFDEIESEDRLIKEKQLKIRFAADHHSPSLQLNHSEHASFLDPPLNYYLATTPTTLSYVI
jgi:hypothetical protein